MPGMQRKIRNPMGAALALAGAAFIYGGWSHVCKAALNAGVEPLVFASYRCSGGAILLAITQCMFHGVQGTGKLLMSLSLQDLRNYAFLGMLILGNLVGYILATSHLPALTCSMFQPAVPVFAATLSVLCGLDRMTLYKSCGMLFSTLGALIVAATGVHTDTPKETASYELGILCALVQVTSSAAYFVYLKSVLDYHPPVFATTLSYSFGSCYVAAFAMYSTNFDFTRWRVWEEDVAMEGLAYAIVLATALNYTVLAWANRETSPAVVTSFQALQPISSALIARIFFGNVVRGYQLVGGLAILMGLGMNVLGQAEEARKCGENSHLFIGPQVKYGMDALDCANGRAIKT